ncbi:hypothetical protein FQA39_LY14256 [Lamprigera yunnana]|nr:hypothetical protein FQA39_LY14256 [Lamprigera yunnana]
MKTKSDIQSYFEDKVIFVTGATGFLGKLIVEKLLRTCNVRKLYITKRPIKNKRRHFEDVEQYFDNTIFDRLKEEKNAALKKVAAVVCDLAMPRLGMSEADLESLKEEVNVVIHAAADVRFNASLKVIACTNIRGTQRILSLCAKLKHLTSLVYVSTAYSNCVKPDVGDELFYDPPLKAHELLTIVEAFDDETLEAITPSILGAWPNTYSFSKSIAEDCIKSYSGLLPVAIIRPSIVVTTASSPIPGWIDGFTNLVGFFIGVIIGLFRTQLFFPENITDIVPADYVVNCLLAAATKIPQDGHIPVYNCVSSLRNPITWKECDNYGTHHAQKVPTPKTVWHKFLIESRNKYSFYILHFLLHMVPAYVADFFMWCLGKKQKCVKEYKKMGEFLILTSYFATKQWIFDDANTQILWNNLNETDQALYPFDVAKLDWNSFFKSSILGCRTYITKDTMDTVPEGHKKIFILKISHYTLVTVITLIVFYILKCLFCFIYNAF